MSTENKNSLKTFLITIAVGFILANTMYDHIANRFVFYGITFTFLIIGVILLIKSKFDFNSNSGLGGVLFLGLFTVYAITVFFLKS